MEEKIFKNFINENPEFLMTWDRGNGALPETKLQFNGFDSDYKPILYIGNEKTRFDLDLIGGYDSIISVRSFKEQVATKF
jgi:hypothetical protein